MREKQVLQNWYNVPILMTNDPFRQKQYNGESQDIRTLALATDGKRSYLNFTYFYL
jgi:hypothetical protein